MQDAPDAIQESGSVQLEKKQETVWKRRKGRKNGRKKGQEYSRDIKSFEYGKNKHVIPPFHILDSSSLA